MVVDHNNQVIYPSENFYYSIDTHEFNVVQPETEIYIDNYHKVTTAFRYKILLFYHYNNISVTANPLQVRRVEELNNEDIEEIDVFSCENLFVRCRITRVIDPVTCEVIFLLPYEFLSQYRMSKGKIKTRAKLSSVTGNGIFIKEVIRFSGLQDSYQQSRDPLKYQIQTEILTSYFSELGNHAYVYFESRREGIYYVNMYRDCNKNVSINEELNRIDHPDLGFLFKKLQLS